MAFIQAADAAVGFFSDGLVREHVPSAANEMPQAVAAECVQAEANDIRGQHERSDADAETGDAVSPREPERIPRVVSKEQKEKYREIKEVSVNILKDQRKLAFAPIAGTRFSDSACGRIGPHRLVVRTSIVITRKSKTAGGPKY